MSKQAHNYPLRGIPSEVWEKLKQLAKAHHRTVRGEILIALESHVKSKPKK
jgi:hypothetical protein